MNTRTEGALRLLLGVPAYLVALLVGPIIMFGSIVVWFLNSSWQVATGREGLSADNVIASAYTWYVGWFQYLAYGQSSGNSSRRKRWLRD